MNSCYLTFVKGISDGTEAREILKFDDIISAKAALHNKMGSAMSDSNCSFAFAIIHNYRGMQAYRDAFDRTEEAE